MANHSKMFEAPTRAAAPVANGIFPGISTAATMIETPIMAASAGSKRFALRIKKSVYVKSPASALSKMDLVIT
ncbi:hypothetical protein UT5_04560 [Ferrigenium sp. UT5]